MLLCRSDWRKAGPDKERISSNLAGGGGPIFSNGKYIISYPHQSQGYHWGDSYAGQVGRLRRNIILPVGSLVTHQRTDCSDQETLMSSGDNYTARLDLTCFISIWLPASLGCRDLPGQAAASSSQIYVLII